jgi:hypothetical protein
MNLNSNAYAQMNIAAHDLVLDTDFDYLDNDYSDSLEIENGYDWDYELDLDTDWDLE